MAITDIFRINKIKAELNEIQKERDALQTTLSSTEHMAYYDLTKAIAELNAKKEEALQAFNEFESSIEKKKQALNQQLVDLNRQAESKRAELNKEFADKRQELILMDEEILLQSFGFYKLRYDLVNSDAYKAKLDQIRDQQALMVKNGKAACCTTNWTINNSQREGERMVKDYVKLILRSFNNECDASIVGVKFNNIESIEKRINKAFDTLNKLGSKMSISISRDYLNLKLQELYLCHEYQLKKQQEKEEQKLLREKMREEAKVLKEIEDMKLKLGKEEKHFAKAIEVVEMRLLQTNTDAERSLLEKEKAIILQKLAEVEKIKLDILNREQNTRAGYVYIISNVGSFGENVYKIGVTRRLDPQERVDELGDASVPFDFDVHALIFSDDAPSLETALHKAFENRRLNLVNRRREFFNVTLEEIKHVVITNFSKPVEIIELTDAAEYRQSLTLKQNGTQVKPEQPRASLFNTSEQPRSSLFNMK